MSWQALNWATRQRVGRASAKHVLMVLANYADENGSCFPSQAQLALDTEMSERAVRDQLDFLECRGAFNRQASRQGNRRGRNRYHLAIDTDLSAPGADAGGEAAEEEGLPANSAGREPVGLNRQTTPSEPANDAVSTGKSCRSYKEEPPVEPPVEPPEERARAQARTLPVEKFLRKWPTAATDNRANIERGWAGLDDGGRQAAIDGVDRYIAELRKNGRKHTPSGGTYLKNRGWEGLPPEPDGPERIAFKNLSRTWWAVVFRKIERGRRPGYMVTHANENPGKDWSASGDDIPSAAEIDRLVAVSSEAPGFAAWLAWLERHGVHLDLWRGGGTFWIWVPGPEPPGQQEARRGEAPTGTEKNTPPKLDPDDVAEFLKS